MRNIPSKKQKNTLSNSNNNDYTSSSATSSDGSIRTNRPSLDRNVDGFGFNSNIVNFNPQEIISHKSALNKAVDRKNQLHFLVKYLWDGNFSSLIEEKLKVGCKVADINCGPASWLLEMSLIYSSTEFHGIDLFGLFPNEIKPTNLEFLQISRFTDTLAFKDNYFDFIRVPFLGNILKKNEWLIVLNELLRILKPGGHLEFLEYGTKIYDAGPKITAFVNEYKNYLESMDRYGKLPIEEILSLSRLQNINTDFRKSRACHCNDDKISDLQFEILRLYFESIVDIFSEYMGITEKEYMNLWDEYEIESNIYPDTYVKLYRVWAQKI